MKPSDVEVVRKLKGSMSAVAVSHMYECHPETIRKIWRNETFKVKGAKPLYSEAVPPVPQDVADGMEEFMGQLMTQSAKGEQE